MTRHRVVRVPRGRSVADALGVVLWQATRPNGDAVVVRVVRAPVAHVRVEVWRGDHEHTACLTFAELAGVAWALLSAPRALARPAGPLAAPGHTAERNPLPSPERPNPEDANADQARALGVTDEDATYIKSPPGEQPPQARPLRSGQQTGPAAPLRPPVHRRRPRGRPGHHDSPGAGGALVSILPKHAPILKAHATDIPRILNALGLPFTTKGELPGSYLIHCPDHDDATPSCRVSIGKTDGNLYARCRVCGWLARDVLALVAKVRGLEGGHRYQELLAATADVVGITLDFTPPSGPRRSQPPPPPVQRLAPVRQLAPVEHRPGFTVEAIDAAARALLSRCPLIDSVGAGLAFRGIVREAVLDGWGELPPPPPRGPLDDAHKGDPYDPFAVVHLAAELCALPEASGWSWLLGPRGFHHPRHRLLIPWRLPDGRVWLLQRRYAPETGDEPKPADGSGKYREEARATDVAPQPYGVDSPSLATAEEVWLVEGAADVLAVRALNRRGLLASGGRIRSLVALGLPGTSVVDKFIPALLPLVAGRRVVLAFDADTAGDSGSKALSDALDDSEATSLIRRTAPAPCRDWADVTRTRWNQGILR